MPYYFFVRQNSRVISYSIFLFQRELLIPVDKVGFVTNLLEESRKFLPIKPSDKLRLVEIASYKIHRVVPNGTSLDTLVQQTPKSYRIEVNIFEIYW